VKSIILLATTLLLFAVTPLNSAANSLNSHPSFDAAIMAFKSGDYHNARRLFLEAENQNVQTEKLYYNLGVVNYKLGYYPSAKTAFLKLLNSEALKPVAMYNLGLIEIKLENNAQAEFWLQQCLQEKETDNKIQVIASSLLQRLDSRPAVLKPLKNKNTSYKRTLTKRKNKSLLFDTILSTQLGYNDNVMQYRYIREITNSNGADNFMELQADSSIKLGKHFSISSSFNDLQYYQNTHYNTSSLLIGANYKNQFKWINYLVHASFLNQTIDSRDYQYLSQLRVTAQKILLQRIRYSMRYGYEIITPQNRIYNYLEGTKQQWTNTLDIYFAKTIASLSYEFETNKRQDFFSNGERYISFSPRSHAFYVNLNQKFRKKLEVNAFGKYIYVYYPTADVVSENFRNYRYDISIEYGFSAFYRMMNNLLMSISIYHISNYSNLSRYRFENNKYMTGVQWNF